MKKENKIIGFHSGHDCSYCVFEKGIPTIHNELERFTRQKEHLGDALEFLFQTYDDYKDVKYFTHVVDNWKGGLVERYPETTEKMISMSQNNGGDLYYFGHHQAHAANAFFSSNFDEALIITIDAGGWDFRSETNGMSYTDAKGGMDIMATTFTISHGSGNNIKRLLIHPIEEFNIGGGWNKSLENIFKLSTGYPYGNQAGTVMAMACMGDHTKYFDYFKDRIHLPNGLNKPLSNELQTDPIGKVGILYEPIWKDSDLENFKQIIKEEGESAQFEISAAIQRATEEKIREQIDPYIKKYKPKNLCLAGGVSLNSVLIGKMYEWYDGIVENIYIPPVPYDAGLSIGSAQILYHNEKFMNQPRIKWEDNSPTYLGFSYHEDSVYEELEKRKDKVSFEKVNDNVIVDLLTKDDNVISVYNGGSESGRRALGNRSILADPRSPNMKDIINEKVKHRQWFRPFAPSILREDVSDWFEIDVDSPYMTTVIKFKESVRNKIPAVVHYDGSARLQTVTENDNKWYYNFIKKFKEKTGVPIVLNTSFNDREPIVETPEHAVNCFLKTDIDYLYFCELQILVKKI